MSNESVVSRRTQAEALALLQDEVDFYGADPSRRAVVETDDSPRCYYHAPDGRCCAVGRHLSDPAEFELRFPGIPVNDVEQSVVGGIRTFLKPEVRGFPIELWNMLQSLHDNSMFWTATGLSDKGQNQVDYIRQRIAVMFHAS